MTQFWSEENPRDLATELLGLIGASGEGGVSGQGPRRFHAEDDASAWRQPQPLCQRLIDGQIASLKGRRRDICEFPKGIIDADDLDAIDPNCTIRCRHRAQGLEDRSGLGVDSPGQIRSEEAVSRRHRPGDLAQSGGGVGPQTSPDRIPDRQGSADDSRGEGDSGADSEIEPTIMPQGAEGQVPERHWRLRAPPRSS